MEQLAQFIILGLAVVAFILALKAATSMLPDQGVPGAIKAAVASV